MKVDIQIFSNSDFGEIRTTGTSENPLFCLADICKVLELGNTSQVRSRLDDGVITNEVIYDTLGRKQETTFVNEDGMYDVILDGRKPQAKAFRKWITSEVIPSIRKTGGYSVKPTLHNSKLSEVRSQLAWVKEVKKLLNLNDASTLGLLQKVAIPLNLPLPDYAPSKGILKSASELLKESGCNMSSQAFNQKMIEKGYMKECTRPSSNGSVKKFKSITGDGLEFGENQVNPNNPKSTQPLCYEDKFLELLKVLEMA